MRRLEDHLNANGSPALSGNASATKTDHDVGDALLHSLFESCADRSPDAPALVSPARTMSYAELERASNRVARHLRRQGIGPGSFVAVYFERSAMPIIAILGALKAGATYVPIDPAFPADRIRHIIEETSLSIFLTELGLTEKVREFHSGPVLALDAASLLLEQESVDRLSAQETGAAPSDLAYLIYTSGTTGKPKGVMAEHRHAYRYTLAFNEICATSASDRVYQGFSLGFDGSIEEIWMAFSNGSALVVADRETPKFGNELGQFLERMGVSYFSTVPTLLATISDPVPSLRTVVVSGEICPAELVNRWGGRPRLRLLNVYGPTEACVNTSAKECLPGRPVTIGIPLRGYDIHILNDDFQPVARGESGELFVGGATLARGYLNRPDLTDEKFLILPELGGQRNVRVYRTGDLVRWNAEGELEFFGRIDSQVKIRGYRVELGEIESVLLEHDNILAASVALIEQNGLQELAAYVELKSRESGLDRNGLLARLELRLPPYMVPGFLDVLERFPRLASGKIDRKQLPAPKEPLLRQKNSFVAPADATEQLVADAMSQVLGLNEVSVEDNFFLDLGGHSLLAAKLVTILRQRSSRHVVIRDVYSAPSARQLAARLKDPAQPSPAEAPAASGATPRSSKQAFFELSLPTYLRTVAAQAASMYLLYGISILPLALVLLSELRWFNGEISGLSFAGALAAVTLFTWPALLALNLAAKWLLIGRYKPGSHALWSPFYFRWWLANRIQALCRLDVLAATPLMPVYARWMGAKVGRNCLIDSYQLSSWDLLRIGDHTSIGMDSQLLGYRVENGMLHIGSVELGNQVFVGIHSALGLNTRMEDASALDDQSQLPDGTSVPAGSQLRGSPAQAARVALPGGGAPESAANPRMFFAAHLALIFLMDLLLMAPVFVMITAAQLIYRDFGNTAGFLAGIALVPGGFTLYALYFVALKRLVLNRAEPGTYSVHSVFYLRKWFTDRLLKLSRFYLLPLYTTLYLPHWMRLLGAKIGRRAELSVLSYFSPDLMELGEESFFADSSIVGGKRFHRGRMQLGFNKVGRRSFVGNSAILPVGASLGSGCLLGVTSAPPSQFTPDNTDWVGSPAFHLPSRQKVGNFDDAVIFRPTPGLYALRALIDGLRILIPSFGAMTAALLLFRALEQSEESLGLPATLALLPLFGIAVMLYLVLVTLCSKWIAMGVIRPEIKPLWSAYVWLNEMVNGIYESLMSSTILPLHGTPFIAPLLRLMGCRIGKHCYIESTLFSEFDLVDIGDYVALNRACIIQNHLFEDRVMKSDHIRIENECSVGNMAVVLYTTEMQRGSWIGPLSLLMKGETLRPGSCWHGIPTVPYADSHTGVQQLPYLAGSRRWLRPRRRSGSRK